MADLVLGPVIRYLSETEATIWVETDGPCEVEVLGERTSTFTVEGHHFALVRLAGLESGGEYPYEVALDGETRWPEAGSNLPPSLLRPVNPDAPLTMAFGSCRVAVPHEPPYTCSKDEDDRGFEFDALRVLATEMSSGDRQNWPEVVLLLGDQVYVDEGSPETREFIRNRRDTEQEPGDEAVDFEEYTRLYLESWSDPLIRWLFSTVSVGMLWDDHDMGDDWNISESWVEEMERKEWWRRRRIAGFMSYWIYQHCGNLSPRELDENQVWRSIRDGGEVTEVLRDFAEGAGKTGDGTRWSFCSDYGRTRLIAMDSRAGRVFDGGKRKIFDDGVWDWITDRASGDFDHLLIATSDPYLLAPAMQDLEAASEQVCAGAWGSLASKLSEKARRAVDFDHWGSFAYSFDLMRKLLTEVGSGQRGTPPASIVILSGDVHHAYLAEVAFPRGSGVRSAVYQAVCSPIRNPLSAKERRVIEFCVSKPAALLGRLLRRASGAPDPGLRWRFCEGPYFDNQVATLRIEGLANEMRLDKTIAGEQDERRLERVFKRSLAGDAVGEPTERPARSGSGRS